MHLDISGQELRAIVDEGARQYQLSPELIGAIIWQESKGFPDAHRYEFGFYLEYIENKDIPGKFSQRITRRTERHDRATSYGLMQVMLQTAREFGYSHDTFIELMVPATGVLWGCRVLAAKIRAAGGDIQRGLLRYNGGGNSSYDDEVFQHLRSGVFEQMWSWESLFSGVRDENFRRAG